MTLVTVRSCALRAWSVTQLCFESVFSPTPGAFLRQLALMGPEARLLLVVATTVRQENGPSNPQKKEESWAQSSGPLFCTRRLESLVAYVCLD